MTMNKLRFVKKPDGCAKMCGKSGRRRLSQTSEFKQFRFSQTSEIMKVFSNIWNNEGFLKHSSWNNLLLIMMLRILVFMWWFLYDETMISKVYIRMTNPNCHWRWQKTFSQSFLVQHWVNFHFYDVDDSDLMIMAELTKKTFSQSFLVRPWVNFDCSIQAAG